MDNFLLSTWRLYPQEILLAAIGLLAVLSLWLLWRQRAAADGEHQLARLLAEQQQVLDAARKELLDAILRGQMLTQDGLHKNLTALQERLDQRSQALQRQLLEDAASLKTELLGRFDRLRQATTEALADGRLAQQRDLLELRQSVEQQLARQRESFEQRQTEALKSQQEALNTGMEVVSRQLRDALEQSSAQLGKRVEGLTESTDKRLQEISAQVEKRLAVGFEKTTETFIKVLEHLSRIDEAQKKITELSGNVVSLQEVLTDKRSRGAFGEVQLAGLVTNTMPEGSYALQQTMSNGSRVDCLLYLPSPTGNVPVDAKFPLESFQRMMDYELAESERNQARQQFRRDIRKHIGDIADKYLIPGETADGAVMFLPAEAVFAEIHAHFPELVEEAQRRRVWLVSPTTLMAVLTTARAVIKDEATRKQVHIIQDHLRYLGEDFGRFQKRMDDLAKHIKQAHSDVELINTSARKITSRFERIDQVQLPEHPGEQLSETIKSQPPEE